jgi:hypothetical protein
MIQKYKLDKLSKIKDYQYFELRPYIISWNGPITDYLELITYNDHRNIFLNTTNVLSEANILVLYGAVNYKLLNKIINVYKNNAGLKILAISTQNILGLTQVCSKLSDYLPIDWSINHFRPTAPYITNQVEQMLRSFYDS